MFWLNVYHVIVGKTFIDDRNRLLPIFCTIAHISVHIPG